ncbi:MAG: murein biosynthesis integral membrane protein MurJ [Candidatus Rokuibacteriota bacterium]|nr:MAG: murein biosynthesis integral membrane protein MurJ [Candidatus Rokubacteria bacterium]
MSGTRCIMPQRRENYKMSGSEGQVVRALGGIAGATLLSRLLGFVRDMVVARAFGAGPITDAFFVAFRIPNILRRLLAEGALSTAMIPVFTEYASIRERPDLLRMLRAVLGLALLALTVTTVLGMLGAPYILPVIAPGFASDPSQAALTVFLTRVMFPYLLLVGLAAMATGVLNSQGRFFAGAIGPAVLNVGMIAAVVLLARQLEPPILSLAIGVLVGGIGQLLVQIPGLSACGLLVAPSGELRHAAIARVTRLLLPAVFGLAAVQVMVFVNTLLASLLPSGSISYLYYADRVMEFPLGVFGIALASASLPVMSRQAAGKDHRALAGTLNFALRLALYVSLPATVGLVMLRTPIVRVLFERGRFGAAETSATADALAWYAVGLVAFAGSRIAAQAFYALGEAGTAVKWGIVSVAANVAAAAVMMGPLGHAGLAGASSVGAYVNLVALLVVARRRLGLLGGRALVSSACRTALASLPLMGSCWLALALWPARQSLLLDVAWLAATIVVGGGAFWIASVALGMPERTVLLRLYSRRERGLTDA